MDRKAISPEQLKKTLSESEAEKKMIRDLQGVFCKGRYSSWVSVQDFLVSREAKKNHKSTPRK